MIESSVIRRGFITALFAASRVLAIGLIACNDDVVPPDPPKDPRIYTWACDTIQYPGSSQTLLFAVWGSSPSSVYAVGHNATSHNGALYRFDGASWKPFAFVAPARVTFGDVLGFGPNSVFFAGNMTDFGSDTGFVMEYNGSNWIQHNLPQNRPGYRFYAIAGLARNDVWVGGGWYPFVFHFDGSAWSRDSLPIAERAKDIVIVSIGIQAADNVWLSAYGYENATGFITHYVLHRTSGLWSVVDSLRGGYPGTEPPWGGHQYWRSPGGTLYSTGNGIFKLVDGQWTRWMDTPFIVNDIYGSSDRSFFVVGVDGSGRGQIAHCDGTSLHTYDQLQSDSFFYKGVWTDGSEVFVVGWDGAKSIVWRGK